MAAVVKAAATRSCALAAGDKPAMDRSEHDHQQHGQERRQRKLAMTWKNSTPINARMATRTTSEMILAMVASPQRAGENSEAGFWVPAIVIHARHLGQWAGN